MNVYLIGYRGTGKTTVARLLARRLGWTAVDADEWLESQAGRSIRTIFAEEGEPAFRDLETATLRQLAQLDRHVVALGGGAVMREENRRLILGGKTIWLKASPDALWQRIERDSTTGERRPNLTPTGGLDEIRSVLARREPVYQACANWTLDTEIRSPEQAAEAIRVWLESEMAPCS